LRSVIPYLPEDGSLYQQYFDVLDNIKQDSSKEEIVRMFCEKGNVTNKLAVFLFKAVEGIEVDIETSISLLHIKKVMPKSSDIDYIFSSVAKKIKSDYEYERVMKAK